MAELKIGTFNFKDGGGGDPTAGLRFLAERRLDALLMQELPDDAERLAEAEKILTMKGAVASGNRGKLHTGIFVNPETFPGFRAFTAEKLGRIRPTDVTTHLAERPNVPITLVSVHLSYNSPVDRLREAYALVPVADKAQGGQPVFIAGDWNELPVQDAEEVPTPDWATVDDRVHRAYRARRCGGGWETITDVDQVLHDMGLTDAAVAVADDHDTTALAATAGHARPDQGGEVRLDRILVADWMREAVADVDVVDTGLSDHRLVTATLSRRHLVELIDTHTT